MVIRIEFQNDNFSCPGEQGNFGIIDSFYINVKKSNFAQVYFLLTVDSINGTS